MLAAFIAEYKHIAAENPHSIACIGYILKTNTRQSIASNMSTPPQKALSLVRLNSKSNTFFYFKQIGYWGLTTIPKTLLWFLPFSGVASWEDDSDPDSVAAFSLLLSVLPSFDFGGLYHKKRKWDKQKRKAYTDFSFAEQN